MPEFILGVFLFTAAWWLIVPYFLVLSIILVLCDKSDSPFWAALWLSVFIVPFYLFGAGIPLFNWIVASPVNAVIGFGSYILAGSLWMWLKWEIHLGKAKKNLGEIVEHVRVSFFEDINEPQQSKVPAELKARWNVYLEEHGYKPVAAESKKRIIGWGIYWPFSLLAYMVGDLLADLLEGIYKALRNIFTHVYNALGQFLDKRSEARYKDVD